MLSALLSAWEEIKAAEEQRMQQEAELFKNKTETSTFQTEEVSLRCLKTWPSVARAQMVAHIFSGCNPHMTGSAHHVSKANKADSMSP